MKIIEMTGYVNEKIPHPNVILVSPNIVEFGEEP